MPARPRKNITWFRRGKVDSSLLEGRLSVKAGRFSTGSEFLTSPIDFSFVNEALNPILLAVQIGHHARHVFLRTSPGVSASPYGPRRPCRSRGEPSTRIPR